MHSRAHGRPEVAEIAEQNYQATFVYYVITDGQVVENMQQAPTPQIRPEKVRAERAAREAAKHSGPPQYTTLDSVSILALLVQPEWAERKLPSARLSSNAAGSSKRKENKRQIIVGIAHCFARLDDVRQDLFW